jgi:Uncharacterised nucleotidyltransferase
LSAAGAKDLLKDLLLDAPLPRPHVCGTNPPSLEALCLRSWALDLLAAQPAARNPESQRRVARYSDRAWTLFLDAERCALPLQRRLRAHDEIADGPAPLLERSATVELQRVLAARAQLLEIGQLASAHGIQAIVLKGSLSALTGPEPLDLADIDLLLPAAGAEPLARELDRRGYRAAALPGPAHLAARARPQGVPVELHFTINHLGDCAGLRQRAQALEHWPGLSRLSAADHLWHVLVHTVVSHPYRRGCLRDVLLTAEALRDSAPADLGDVQSRIAQHAHAAPLAALLAMGESVVRGDATVDQFESHAAAHYLLRHRFAWLARWRALMPMTLTVFVLLGGDPDRRVEWADAWNVAPSSTWSLLSAIQRVWPRLGRGFRGLLRAVRVPVGRLLAVPVAARAKSLARQAAEARNRLP